MTGRLYYSDSYLTEFTASVTSVDGPRVYLDRTALYPTSGGQAHDRGKLDGLEVVDVVDEGSRIAHVLTTPAPFHVGTELSGTVDWPRRFDHMQQHTGQHLLSALFEELCGHKTESVHFGDTSSTLDLDAPTLSLDRALLVERRANEVVLENRPVTVSFEDSSTAAGLRKPPDRSGELRIVAIEGLDRSACGGTHVQASCEIGPVMVRRVEKVQKGWRVEFLCGWRALDRSRSDQLLLSQMARVMTAAIDELPTLLVSRADELRDADRERRRLSESLSRYRARELYDAISSDGSGVRKLVDRASPMDELRLLAQATSRLPKAVFVGAGLTPPAVVYAASEDSGIDAAAVLRQTLAPHGGRGGGSPRVAQGTVGDAAAVDTVVAALLRHEGA